MLQEVLKILATEYAFAVLSEFLNIESIYFLKFKLLGMQKLAKCVVNGFKGLIFKYLDSIWKCSYFF